MDLNRFGTYRRSIRTKQRRRENRLIETEGEEKKEFYFTVSYIEAKRKILPRTQRERSKRRNDRKEGRQEGRQSNSREARAGGRKSSTKEFTKSFQERSGGRIAGSVVRNAGK